MKRERFNSVSAIGISHPVKKLAVGALCSVCVFALLFVLLSCFFPLPAHKPYSLLVEDRNGEFLQAFLAEDGIWRLKTSPDEIPKRLKQVLIEKEDKYFYYHPGINPFAVCRALIQNISAGRRASGASTLTMQVARMLERRERTYPSKLIEVFRALQLEWTYSKDEILQLYLSMVPLGGNIEGLKSASMIYYQTPLERLNIAQLFDLILIPNNPNRLQPDRNPQPLYEERLSQSRRWIESGFFSREDSIVIANTAAIAVRQQLPRYAPHFCLRVKRTFNGESDIRSSLDLKTQKTVEALLSNHIRPWKKQGINNGAVVVIENASREIVAYVGSENFDDENAQGQVDAVKALRSPGSTLKPFLVAMEMERGVLTPRTRLLDVPYDAEGFLAENYDGKYSGLVYVDEALRRSLNVPMIRLLKEAGVQPFIQLAGDVGIASLQEQKRKLGLSMILGGCGVMLEELTAAYSTFPSGGIFIQPKYIHMGIAPSKEGREVFSASTAYMVTDILIGLDRPDLPNNFESSLNLPTIAFKTGTSYGRRDAWSIGYTAEFTIGVWLGNVTHKGNPDLVGGRVAAPLLVSIFNSISTRHQKIILSPPKDVKIREVCAHSGHIPTPQCSHLVFDLYSEKHTLNQICEVDKEYQVSTDGKEVFCSSCVGNVRYKMVTYQNYPPELLSLWKSTGTSVPAVPPHHLSCTRLFAGEGPKIISPSEDMTYFIVSKEQKMMLQASSDLDVKEHIWYLDDKYLGRSNAGDKLFITLKDGEHAITCLDDKGRMNSTKIKIKYVL